MRQDIISKTVQNMQPSGIRTFFDLVLGMKDVISLGVGEPDFVTPWQVRESGIFALEKGMTTYTSNKGLLRLRLEIARHLKQRFSLSYNPADEILITVGVSEGLDLSLRAILNPGDKVLIPVPSYVSYGPVTNLCGGEAVYLLTTSKNGFKLKPHQIEEAVDSSTRAIILNYPANPTGVSYTKQELESLKRVILKHGLICISDEVYDELTYDFRHTPFATLKGAKPNTIYLNGFSKSYAMTGWRIGFACGPKEIIAGMTKIHQYTIMCVPTISQWAACEAIQTGQRDVDRMRKEYEARREFVVSELNRIGLKCHKPQGAFYCFPSIKNSGLSAIDFCRQLLKEERVAVVPGIAFGPGGEGCVRISYASSLESLREAIMRIERFLRRRRQKSIRLK